MKLPRLPARLAPTSAPLLLLLICGLAYLPMIHRLGFYWDDWPSVWFLHFWGGEGFREGFASDRPLLAWVFMLTTPIFGESTAAWQIFSVFTRWLTSLAWWWSLRGLWPGQPRQAFWGALLFALFPGFSQQYIAVTYSNAFLVYFLFILSIGTMIWAERKREWFWILMAVSVALSAFSMFITEYFYGLELLRPFLLWVVLAGRGLKPREKIRRIAVRWAPYLVVLIPFLGWRALSNSSPRAKIMLFDDLAVAPLSTLVGLARTAGQDFIEANFLAWFYHLDLRFLNTFDPGVLRLLAGFSGAVFGLTLLYLLWLKEPAASGQSPGTPVRWARQTAGLGIAAFLVSGWPIWVTDLRFELFFPFDRFLLITMLGTSLLFCGLIGLLDRRPWVSAVLVAVLAAASAGIQFQQRLYYRQEWLAQKNFFWQLVWRAPGLAPGTTLMTSEIPFRYYSDNSLSAPLNWIYAPGNTSRQMETLLFDIEARLGETISALEPEVPIRMPYRAAQFEGSTSQAVVLFYDPPRCLKVMNPEIDRFLPVKPLYIREAAPLSRLDLILPESDPAALPPAHIFGPEPAHAWCYYFEKAELYAQLNEWERVVEMADRALKINKHFTEKNVSELIPFIMGYAHTEDWEKAVELSETAYQVWDKTQYPLCDAWNSLRLKTSGSESKQAALAEIANMLSCTFPETQ